MRSQGKPDTARLSAAEILDVVLDQVAEEAAERGESTTADERWAQELHAKLHARIGELRRQVTPSRPPSSE